MYIGRTFWYIDYMMKKGNDMQLLDLLDDIDDTVSSYVKENATPVKPSALGLDERCYTTLYCSSEFIAVKGPTRNLDYYGGFEYIDDEDRRQTGSYTFYLSSSERVRTHLVEARRLLAGRMGR